jgi:subtilisin family serine protease
VNVEVTLKVNYNPVEEELPPEQRAAQAAAIRAAQQRLLKRMEPHIDRLIRLGKTKREYIRVDDIPVVEMAVDEEGLKDLISNPDVLSIEEPMWGTPALLETIPLTGAEQAWAAGFTGGGYTVAILDTGVDASHPFLSGKVIAEACFSSSGSGPDPIDGTWIETSFCPDGSTAQVGLGTAGPCTGILGCDHGTHVAGIAAGSGTSFSGVAKGANVIAVQVFSRVEGAGRCAPAPSPCIQFSLGNVRRALQWLRTVAGTYNLVSANMSLQVGAYANHCDSDSAALERVKTAIDNLVMRRVATVAAAGNYYQWNALAAPACLSSAISVGATTKTDAVADYSNSASFLNLLAPGGDGSGGSSAIYSSVPGGGFAYQAGTSQAAPHVAGAFAVLRQQSPTANVNDIKSILESSGVPILDTRNNVTKPRIRLSNTPWIARYNGPARSEDEVSGVATDSAGNVYVTGTSCNDEGCDASDFATVKYSASGQRRWVRRFENGFMNVSAAITVDAARNVYVAGASCPDLVCINADFVTVKYDRTGNLLWTARYINSGTVNYNDNSPVAIAVDGAGNIHIAGTACNTSEDCNIVVIKYASDGTQLWVAGYHNVEFDGASDMALDMSGNVHVAGNSCFTSPCQTNSWSSNVNPIALKYDGNGNQLWLARYVDEYSGNANSIAIDQAGSIYIAGWKSSGGTPSALQNDLLVRYYPDGNQLWHVSSGLEGRNNDVIVDGTGSVLVTGISGNFGYSTRKYTNAGALLWEAMLAESDVVAGAGGEAFALSVDSTNSPVVVGDVSDVFSNGTYIGTVKYDTNGNHVWKYFFSGRSGGNSPSPPRTPVVTVDNTGNVFIAGTVSPTDIYGPTDYVTLKYSP